MSVQPAGQPVTLQSTTPDAGVLLIHGLHGSLRDMAEVEEVLQRHNLITRSMLLPGHGSQAADLHTKGWPEWEAAVLEEFQALQQQCQHVFLVGHSLGAALALHTAAHQDVAGLVSMCAPLELYRWLKPLMGAAKRVLPLAPFLSEKLPHRADRAEKPPLLASRIRPVESILEYLPVLREELPRITAPVLIMTSVRDQLVPARNGRIIYHLVGSREKYLVTFHHSYHVIMKDHDREEVFAKTEAFILRYAHNVRRTPF